MESEEGQVIGCRTVDDWNLLVSEARINNKLTVVDFTASWCEPCRLFAPILADMAKKTPHVIFLKVDVDELQSVAEGFNVGAMPTFVFLKEGNEVHRVVGAKKEELLIAINNHASASTMTA